MSVILNYFFFRHSGNFHLPTSNVVPLMQHTRISRFKNSHFEILMHCIRGSALEVGEWELLETFSRESHQIRYSPSIRIKFIPWESRNVNFAFRDSQEMILMWIDGEYLTKMNHQRRSKKRDEIYFVVFYLRPLWMNFKPVICKPFLDFPWESYQRPAFGSRNILWDSHTSMECDSLEKVLIFEKQFSFSRGYCF